MARHPHLLARHQKRTGAQPVKDAYREGHQREAEVLHVRVFHEPSHPSSSNGPQEVDPGDRDDSCGREGKPPNVSARRECDEAEPDKGEGRDKGEDVGEKGVERGVRHRWTPDPRGNLSQPKHCEQVAYADRDVGPAADAQRTEQVVEVQGSSSAPRFLIGLG